MSLHSRKRPRRQKPARAPMVACCEVCGGPMSERKGKHACSSRCRAELSRRRRRDALAARDGELRRLLEAALAKLRA
jgi:predicted nucleic acid-binding Zn ribbon protein